MAKESKSKESDLKSVNRRGFLKGASAPRVSNTPRTLESFIRYVRKPARMPPYVNRVMSDEQLTDVYAFLLSVPPSPDAESIPMLRDLLDSR
ncbi:MAG: hypothetical protein O7E57_09095 [Gammaproteobacteria bacterium]|nr:hypothetical protein [Gammaproteobacteria bacterium]